jgi:hypothetical protein
VSHRLVWRLLDLAEDLRRVRTERDVQQQRRGDDEAGDHGGGAVSARFRTEQKVRRRAIRSEPGKGQPLVSGA